MMYLSRVRVATEGLSPHTLCQLMQGDAYGNHQLLWKLFPNQDGRPFLFRQELEKDAPSVQRPRGLPMFYVLSEVEPQPTTDVMECETKPFIPRLQRGQQLAFRLRANPTIAKQEEGRKNSRHHDVLMDAKWSAKNQGRQEATTIQARMDEAAKQWLQDEQRATRYGYRLQAEPQVSGYRQHTYRRKGREIRFSSVDYEGTLEVTDTERFHQTLAQGIGRSRAFGCGMWMIRRI